MELEDEVNVNVFAITDVKNPTAYQTTYAGDFFYFEYGDNDVRRVGKRMVLGEDHKELRTIKDVASSIVYGLKEGYGLTDMSRTQREDLKVNIHSDLSISVEPLGRAQMNSCRASRPLNHTEIAELVREVHTELQEYRL
jgi:hypothetical protein